MPFALPQRVCCRVFFLFHNSHSELSNVTCLRSGPANNVLAGLAFMHKLGSTPTQVRIECLLNEGPQAKNMRYIVICYDRC